MGESAYAGQVWDGLGGEEGVRGMVGDVLGSILGDGSGGNLLGVCECVAVSFSEKECRDSEFQCSKQLGRTILCILAIVSILIL